MNFLQTNNATSSCSLTDCLWMETDNEADPLLKYNLPDLSTTVPTREADHDTCPTPLYLSLLQRNFHVAHTILITKPITNKPSTLPGYEQANTWIFKKDKDGKMIWRTLPLHAAISFGAPYDPLVDLLIHVSPLSIRMQDYDGRLPIHLAFASCASEELINRLIMLYPDCVGVRDKSGKLPDQCCSKKNVLPISVYAEMRANMEREKVLKQLQSEKEQELKIVREQSELKMNELKTGYEEKAIAAVQEHEKKLNTLKDALKKIEGNHVRQLLQAKDSTQKEIYKVVGDHAVEIAELNKKMMAEAEEMNQTIETAKEEHEQEINAIDEQHQLELEQRQEAYNADKDELASEIVVATEEAEQIRQETGAIIEENEQKYRELEERMWPIQAECLELRNRINELEQIENELKKSFKDREDMLDSISEKLSAVSRECAELESDIDTEKEVSEQKFAEAQEANQEMTIKIDELKQKLDMVTLERDAFAEQIEELQTVKAKLDERLSESETIRRSIQKEISMVVRERDECEYNLKRVADEQKNIEEMVPSMEMESSRKVQDLEQNMAMKKEQHHIEIKLATEHMASMENEYDAKMKGAQEKAKELEVKYHDRIKRLENNLIEKEKEHREAMDKQKKNLELVVQEFKRSFYLPPQLELEHPNANLNVYKGMSPMAYSDAIEIFVAHY